jgi:hypothetical protein
VRGEPQIRTKKAVLISAQPWERALSFEGSHPSGVTSDAAAHP